MNTRKVFLYHFFSVAAAITPSVALADDGHVDAVGKGDTLLHFLASPKHILPAVAVGLVLCVSYRLFTARNKEHNN